MKLGPLRWLFTVVCVLVLAACPADDDEEGISDQGHTEEDAGDDSGGVGADTGGADDVSADTGGADTSAQDTGAADTVPQDTTVADTSVGDDAGGEDATEDGSVGDDAASDAGGEDLAADAVSEDATEDVAEDVTVCEEMGGSDMAPACTCPGDIATAAPTNMASDPRTPAFFVVGVDTEANIIVLRNATEGVLSVDSKQFCRGPGNYVDFPDVSVPAGGDLIVYLTDAEPECGAITNAIYLDTSQDLRTGLGGLGIYQNTSFGVAVNVDAYVTWQQTDGTGAQPRFGEAKEAELWGTTESPNDPVNLGADGTAFVATGADVTDPTNWETVSDLVCCFAE